VATIYLASHDHPPAAWQAGARENAGTRRWDQVQPFAIALFTAPGTPMISNGQELAEDYWLREDDPGTGRCVKPRPLRWGFKDDGSSGAMRKVFTRLIALRRQFAGLRSDNFYPPWEGWMNRLNAEGSGIDADSRVVIYHRWGEGDTGRLERFIVVLNLSPRDQLIDVPFSANGTWVDVLNGTTVIVADCWLRGAVIGSNWGHVYFQEGVIGRPHGAFSEWIASRGRETSSALDRYLKEPSSRSTFYVNLPITTTACKVRRA
jgi:hypothetical protein